MNLIDDNGMSYLEELEHGLGDAHFVFHSGVREVEIGRRVLGRPHDLGLPFLADLRRLFRVGRVDLVPILHPIVRGHGTLDDHLPGDVFIVVVYMELQQLDLLLRIE